MTAQRVPYSLLVVLLIIFKVSCEKTSLTFVIDDTGSMGDDIDQVRNDVDAIMNIVLHEKSSQISNIVLTTFNDPMVQLRIITDNPKKLKNTLSRIFPLGGWDCPEMALSGIKLALESSLPGSYIYVFTDASAKDYWMAEEIQQLCQRKQSQIVFVLTGDCGQPNSPKFQVYNDIATASSGLAFRVDKVEVHKVVTGVIKETIQGNKNVLTTKKLPAYEWTDVPFSIDDQTEYAIVSASGRDVQMEIRGQYEEKKNLLWTRHAKVVKLIHPSPGDFVATVRGTSTTSVNVVARSDFKFRHGFSILKPKSIDDTAPQPFKDTLTHLSISVTDPHSTVQVQSVQIMDIEENKIGNNIPLKEMAPNFYTTEPFVAPSHIFKVAVIGINTRTGKETRKIAKIPVIPQAAPKGIVTVKNPEVNIPEGPSIGVTAGSAVTLTCKVAAYPMPIITWRNETGVTVQSTSSQVQIPYDYISYLKIPYVSKDSKYYCHAVNSLDKDFKPVSVIIKEPFIIKSVPKGTTKIYYGAEHTIQCDVQALEPYKINWYHVDKLSGKNMQITSSEKYSISSDSRQLKILSMDVDQIGDYTCKVHLLKDLNKNRMFSTNVEIKGLVTPKIDPHSNVIEIAENGTAVINCKISKGVPQPAISWKFKPSERSSIEYKNIMGSGNQLRVSRAQLHDSGSYQCVAVNVEGRDEQVVAELVVLKPPIVTIEEGDNIKLKYRSQMTLHCKVTANPTPNVSWNDDKGNMLFIQSSGSNYNYQYTYTSTGMKESGKFVCRAENKQGSDTKSIKVTVLSPFDVKSIPNNSVVIYGSPANLHCDIRSHLPIKIDWYLVSKSVEEVKKLSSSHKYWISSDGTQLKIKSMDVDMTGLYTCKAFLIEEPIKSISFAANVAIEGLESPKIIGDIDKKVITGESVTITCNVVQGIPRPIVSWQYKTTNTDNFEDLRKTGNVLNIPSVKGFDAGFYKCTAKNSEGINELVIKLTVEEPPRIIAEEFTEYEGLTGDIAMRILCDAVGDPKPTIEWKIEGSVVTIGNKYNVENGALIIKNPEEADTNLYTCTATNYLGSDTKAFNGTVYDKLNGEGPRTNVTLNTDISTKLECKLPRTDPSTVQWFIGEAVIDGASIDVYDDGNYTCHVSDAHGSATETYVVREVYGPRFLYPHEFPVVNLNDHALEVLHCNVEAQPEAEVQWIHNDKLLNYAGEELAYSEIGNYKCIVSNEYGTIERTFTVTE